MLQQLQKSLAQLEPAEEVDPNENDVNNVLMESSEHQPGKPTSSSSSMFSGVSADLLSELETSIGNQKWLSSRRGFMTSTSGWETGIRSMTARIHANETRAILASYRCSRPTATRCGKRCSVDTRQHDSTSSFRCSLNQDTTISVSTSSVGELIFTTSLPFHLAPSPPTSFELQSLVLLLWRTTAWNPRRPRKASSLKTNSIRVDNSQK